MEEAAHLAVARGVRHRQRGCAPEFGRRSGGMARGPGPDCGGDRPARPYGDLSVVARSGPQYVIDTDRTFHGALWESGCPVLLVPGGSGTPLFDTVVIAWRQPGVGTWPSPPPGR